jgi:hypothetical protein
MLPLFSFILSFSYITWLLIDAYDEAGAWVLVINCSGDLRGTGGFLDDI